MDQPPIKSIGNLRPGDHLCLVYDTEQDHRAALTAYVRDGLRHGEKVVYFADTHTPAVLIDYLQYEPSLAHALNSGQFQLLTAETVYLRDGTFDPERMIRFLLGQLERALNEGYPALRATGEMTWALRKAPGADALFEYESRLNNVLPGRQIMGLCQYHRGAFLPEALLHTLLTHPLACAHSRLVENRSYVPPVEYLKPSSREAVLDRLSRLLSWRPAVPGRALEQGDINSLLATLGLPTSS